jgi:hypothetical protein
VRVKADGTFDLTSLVGPRELRVQGVPAGWMVTALRAGDRDLLDTSIDFTGTEHLTDVEVVRMERPAPSRSFVGYAAIWRPQRRATGERSRS